MQGKYLITTDNYFFGPDGRQYRAVWGNVSVFEDNKVLGIKTNIRATNWYVKVGSEENHVIVAGCQIHYATRCEERPETTYTEHTIEDSVEKTILRPDTIYIAE